MKQILTLSAVAIVCAALIISCTKTEATKNYTCNCTIIESQNGVVKDTVTQSIVITATPTAIEADCNQSGGTQLTTGGITRTATCTYH